MHSSHIQDPLNRAQILDELSPGAADWLADLEVFKTIGSTNDRIIEKLALNDPPLLEGGQGFAVTSEFQSAGKGRRGKKWEGERGLDIALSLLWPVQSPAEASQGLSLVVGLAVLSAIKTFHVAGLSLKWPNDILLDGNKLGGILIELVQEENACFAVIGVGLNMGGAVQKQASIEQAIADLAAHAIQRNALLSALISNIHEFCSRYDEQGLEPFRRSWNELHHFHHEQVVLSSAASSVAGRVTGIGLCGELLLEDSGGEINAYYAGEVSMRSSA